MIGRRRRPEGGMPSQTHPELEYFRLRDLRRRDRRKLIDSFRDDVFVESFPDTERPNFDHLHQQLVDNAPRAEAVVAVEEDGSVVSGVVADGDEETRVYMVAYLASRPDRRNEGVVTDVFQEMAAMMFVAIDPTLLLGEIDDPLDVEPGPFGDPVARIRLYHRLGLQLLEVPYVIPTIPPAPRRGSLLVLVHADPAVRAVDADGHECVRSGPLNHYMHGYYRACEGEGYADTPEVAEMFSYLDDRDVVRILPLDQWESCPRVSPG